MRVLAAIFVAYATTPALAAEPKLSAKVEKVAVPEALAEPVRKLLDEQFMTLSGNPTTHRIRYGSEDLACPVELLGYCDYERLAPDASSGTPVEWFWSGRGTGPLMLGTVIVAHCFPEALTIGAYRELE